MTERQSASRESPQIDRGGPREISLLDLYDAVRSSKLIIAVLVALFATVALVLAFVMKPIYRATVILAPVDDKAETGILAGAGSQFAGLASLVGIDLGTGTSRRDEAIAVLRSRAFTEKFILENELMPVIYADLWDAKSRTWRVHDPADSPSIYRAFRKFDRDIRGISEDELTGLVTVTVEWKDPKLAAAWANTLVNRLNQYMRDRAIVEARRSIQYLERELQKTSLVGVQDVIHRLIETQINTIMLAEVRAEYAFRVIDPAVASTPKDFVRPKRLLMVAGAVCLGSLIGIMIAGVRALHRRPAYPARQPR